MTTSYSSAALDVIAESQFQILPDIYVYAKVSKIDNVADHFLITKDGTEITVVTTHEKLKSLELVERNKDDYRLIALDVSVPFYSVGFLATVTDALASNGMNVLVVSTYSKDYMLIRADLIAKAEAILLSLGFDRTG